MSRGPHPVRRGAPKPSVQEWLEQGQALVAVRSQQEWALSDWVAAGHAQWGIHAIDRAAASTGLGSRQLFNLLLTATTYPKGTRRWSVSWSHYLLAARLGEADRARLLTEAEVGSWSARQLGAAIRECLSREKSAPAMREATFDRRLAHGRHAAVREIKAVRSLVHDVRRHDVSQWTRAARRRAAADLERTYNSIGLAVRAMKPEVEEILKELRREGPHDLN